MKPLSDTNPGLILPFFDTYAKGAPGGYASTLCSDIAAALAVRGWPCRPVALWQDTNETLARIFRSPPPFVINLNLLPEGKFVDLSVGGGIP